MTLPLLRWMAAAICICLSAPVAAEEVPSLHIYVLMGQSNMAGRDTADMEGQPPDPRILTLDAANHWVVAKDPVHAKTSSIAPGVGPSMAFAREMLVSAPAVQIGLVPTAVGGTPLRRWVKGADLYEQAVARARAAAKAGVLRGVLWHQGETDARTQADAGTYEARLGQMFKDLRQDLGQPDLPIVVGQLGDFLAAENFPAAAGVREALQQLPRTLPRVGLAPATGLQHKGDHLHFSSDSARELGRRFAHAMQALHASDVTALWPPGRMPGRAAAQPETWRFPERRDALRVTHVSEPALTLYRPPHQGQLAPAVIVVPGGGYQHVAMDKEGADVAAWLNAQGFTALVLKYRVPDNREGAFADIQRAIQLTRSRSADWQIDPHRLGVMGFSAGGHLAARASTNFSRCPAGTDDGTEGLSCRPDFAVLVYPAYLDDAAASLSAPLSAREAMPPLLIVHSEDDRKYVTGTHQLRTALASAGQHVHALIYTSGGHGYGLRSRGDAQQWPADALPWLAAQRIR